MTKELIDELSLRVKIMGNELSKWTVIAKNNQDHQDALSSYNSAKELIKQLKLAEYKIGGFPLGLDLAIHQSLNHDDHSIYEVEVNVLSHGDLVDSYAVSVSSNDINLVDDQAVIFCKDYFRHKVVAYEVADQPQISMNNTLIQNIKSSIKKMDGELIEDAFNTLTDQYANYEGYNSWTIGDTNVNNNDVTELFLKHIYFKNSTEMANVIIFFNSIDNNYGLSI